MVVHSEILSIKNQMSRFSRCLTLSQYDLVTMITDHSSQSNLCANVWLTNQGSLLDLLLNQFHEQIFYPTSASPHCSYGVFSNVTCGINAQDNRNHDTRYVYTCYHIS